MWPRVRVAASNGEARGKGSLTWEDGGRAGQPNRGRRWHAERCRMWIYGRALLHELKDAALQIPTTLSDRPKQSSAFAHGAPT